MQLGRELRIVGQLELLYPVRLEAIGTPDPLRRADADPQAFAVAEPVRWLAPGGGPASVSATTRSATVGPSGGMREGRVLSRQSPAIPASRKRSCQRQITVLALPVASMISAVPRPFAVRRMILARQPGFCGLLRLATTAASSLRSAALSRILVRFPRLAHASHQGSPQPNRNVRFGPILLRTGLGRDRGPQDLVGHSRRCP